MPAQAEPLLCHRYHRPVEISRDQFGVFEHKHFVCFHYAYEHDPADPDEECAVGGCPYAAVNPRPDRRPGIEPPVTTRSSPPTGSGSPACAGSSSSSAPIPLR